MRRTFSAVNYFLARIKCFMESLILALAILYSVYLTEKEALIMKNRLETLLVILSMVFICGVEDITDAMLNFSTVGTLLIAGTVAFFIGRSEYRRYKKEQEDYLSHLR